MFKTTMKNTRAKLKPQASCYIIDALHDLLPVIQLKKRGKPP